MIASSPAPNAAPANGLVMSLAYSTIREHILSGSFPGGHRLREDDLATMVGVSRTPIREALRSLAAEGLVNYEHNRGFQVESWTLKDVGEIQNLRVLLEPYAANLAATSGLLDIDALTALAEDMERAIGLPKLDVGVITELNNRFHDAILVASGNQRLRLLVNSIVQVPIVHRTFAHYTPEDLKRSLTHHQELVESLSSGDPIWAESVMRAHMRFGWMSTVGRFQIVHPSATFDSSIVEP